MNSLGYTILLAGVALLTVGVSHGRQRLAEELVRDWAQRAGLELLSCRQPLWHRGPFAFSSRRTQAIFLVVVREREGKSRAGWVRVSGYRGGIVYGQVEVRWEA